MSNDKSSKYSESSRISKLISASSREPGTGNGGTGGACFPSLSLDPIFFRLRLRERLTPARGLDLFLPLDECVPLVGLGVWLMSKPKSRLRVNFGDKSNSGIGVTDPFSSSLVRPRAVHPLLPVVRIDEDVLAPCAETLVRLSSPSSTLVGVDDKESAGGVAGSDHSLVDVDDKDGHVEEAELVLGT